MSIFQFYLMNYHKNIQTKNKSNLLSPWFVSSRTKGEWLKIVARGDTSHSEEAGASAGSQQQTKNPTQY